jgi:adenylate kinase family enzyme/YHS domain-containing protein
MNDVFTRKFVPDSVVFIDVQEEKQEEEGGEENLEGAIEDPNAGPFESKTKYKQWIDELESKFNGAGVKVTKVTVPRDENAALHSICREIDPFICDAEPATAEDLPQPEEEQEESDEPKPEKFEKEVFGKTKNYCPVVLKQKGILVIGSDEFPAKYRNKIYLLNSEEERNDFLAKPMFYTTNVGLKPPRIWIIGHSHSGRSSLAALLLEKYQMPTIKLEDEFLKNLSDQNERVKQFVHALDNPPPKEKKPKGEDDEEEPEEEEKDEETIKKEKIERLVKIFAEMVQEEPFASHGYVLDGYPQDDVQSQLLLEKNFYPDLVLQLQVSEETFQKRVLPQKLEKAHKDRLNRKLETKRKEEEQKIAKKRKKRPKEDDEEPPEEEEPEPLPTDEEVKEQLIESYNTTNDVLTALAESYNEKRIAVRAIDCNRPIRIVNNTVVEATHSLLKSRNSIFNFKSSCSHNGGIQLVRSGRKHLNRFGFCDPVQMYNQGKELYYRVQQNIETIVHGDDTQSLVGVKRKLLEEKRQKEAEEAEKLRIEQEKAQKKAERLKRIQEKQNGDDDEPEEEPEEPEEEEPEQQEEQDDGEEKPKPKSPKLPEISFPVIFDHDVYFFNSEENRKLFLSDPMLYVKQDIPPKHLLLVPKIAILSSSEYDATCGKLVESVAKKLHIVPVGVLEIVQKIILSESSTSASRKVKSILDTHYKTQEAIDRVLLATPDDRDSQLATLLPDTLLLPLLKHRLESFDCWVHGYSLENISKVNHIQFVEKDGKILDKIFLIGDKKHDGLSSIQRYFESEHTSEATWVDPTIPNWNMQVLVQKVENDSLKRRGKYLQSVENDLPAPIYDTGVLTPSTFKKKLSPFQQYSVVSYVDSNTLIDTEDVSHKHCAEFRGKIYCTHDAASFKQFLAKPETYANERYKLPENLPKYAHSQFTIPSDSEKEEIEDDKTASQFEFKGFDPVLLKSNKDGHAIAVWGKNRFAVSYAKKLYRMASDHSREQFMQQPWLYIDAKLPAKLPVRKKDYPSLGIVEYLDEATAKIVTRALVELNKVRPKYPYLTKKESSLKFLSLFIRANHEGYKEERRKRCQRDYEEFLSRCDLLAYFGKVKEREKDPELFEKNAKLYDAIKHGEPVPGHNMY